MYNDCSVYYYVEKINVFNSIQFHQRGPKLYDPLKWKNIIQCIEEHSPISQEILTNPP